MTGTWRQTIHIISIMAVGISCNSSPSTIQRPQTQNSPKSLESSCKPTISKSSSKEPSKLALANKDAFYEGDIKTILEDKCVKCHPNYGTFTRASRDGKRIVASIENGSMPPGPDLLPEDQELFQSWLTEGFPEEKSDSAEADEAQEPTLGKRDSSSQSSSSDCQNK